MPPSNVRTATGICNIALLVIFVSGLYPYLLSLSLESFSITTISSESTTLNKKRLQVVQSINKRVTNTSKPLRATKNATIVVYLSGEMGNHLSVIAKAYSTKLLALERYNIAAKLVFRHQLVSKWTHAKRDLKKCFPKLATYDFSAANSKAFDKLQRKQAKYLARGHWDPARLQLDSFLDNKTSIESALSYWNQVLDSPSLFNVTAAAGEVSFPFLTVGAPFCPLDMLDRYHDEIQSFFEFDRSKCCHALPSANETVFVSVVHMRAMFLLISLLTHLASPMHGMKHLRNFQVELKRVYKTKGFEELSPNKTAHELFDHLHSGDKIAITTRFGGDRLIPYITALQQQGLQVRVIEKQSGPQDFCFMMSAKKELVGTFKSTFAAWAAYLGNMKRASLYVPTTPNSVPRISISAFNWTHQSLKDRVYLEHYKTEEQDVVEHASLSREDERNSTIISPKTRHQHHDT